jgi:hypothetical protein
MDGLAIGRVQIEDQQRHGHREDAVAQCGEALHALAGDAVVREAHWRHLYMVPDEPAYMYAVSDAW